MIEVVPTGSALGTEIRGVDLSQSLEPAGVGVMLDAWSEHLVLLFREQDITDPELIEFSRHFGDLDPCPPNSTGWQHSAEHPELAIVSNVIVDGQPLGSLGDGELRWHTDMSNHAVPPKASILHALEVPPEGGETGFCNMYAATLDLPEQLRAAIEGKSAYQDGTYDSAGVPHKGLERGGEWVPPRATARRAPADAPPSRHGPSGTLSRTPPQSVHRRHGRRRERELARCTLGACHPAAIHLVP